MRNQRYNTIKQKNFNRITRTAAFGGLATPPSLSEIFDVGLVKAYTGDYASVLTH
jgi:hypothetical protein